MDSQYEAHIRRLDAQIQALKHQQIISNQIISTLIFQLQILKSGETDLTDPNYCQIQAVQNALRTLKPLRARADV